MTTHDDPFAGLSLASGYDEIIGRMDMVREAAESGDAARLSVISLQYLAFLDRVIGEADAAAVEDPTLPVIRAQRAMLGRMFGERIAESVPGTRH